MKNRPIPYDQTLRNLDPTPRVVGGTIEPDYQFPWVVIVSGTLTGRGVLITPNWVLTAAHLVETSFIQDCTKPDMPITAVDVFQHLN